MTAGLGEVRLLTVAEVAGLLRVSRMTVYRLIHDGTLPSMRIGKSYRVPEHVVRDYLHTAYTDAG